MAWRFERSHFQSDGEYFFVLVALFVGLGTLWQFPFVTYQCGGIVFLIPFTIVMLILGLPYVYLALDFGQYALAGPVVAFRDVLPGFIGVGIVQALLQFFITVYYSLTATHLLYYGYVVVTNFNGLPWSSCTNWWNAAPCRERGLVLELINDTGSGNTSNVMVEVVRPSTYNEDGAIMRAMSPEVQFFERRVLAANQLGNATPYNTFFNPGPVLGHLALTHLVTWAIIFVGVMLGIVLLGAVTVFTVAVSYVLLSVVFIRFVILPGADEGIRNFFQPDISVGLGQYQSWIAAANVVFVMLALGRGVLVTIGSYQRRAYEVRRGGLTYYDTTQMPTRPVSPTLRDTTTSTTITRSFPVTTSRSALRYACAACAMLYATCLFFTLIHASLVGFVAYGASSSSAASIADVVAYNLTDFFARIVPAATSAVPLGGLWALFIYIAAFMLCIDGIMLSAETTLASIRDWFPRCQSFLIRPVMAFIFCALGYALGLCMLTPAGVYIQQWFDMLITLPELIAALLAIIGYVWVYVARRRTKAKLTMQLETHQPHSLSNRHVRVSNFRRQLRVFVQKSRPVQWAVLAVLAIFCVIIIGALVYQRTPATDNDWYYEFYAYPTWSKIILWLMVGGILAIMPLAAIVQWFRLRKRAFMVVYNDKLLYPYDYYGTVEQQNNNGSIPLRDRMHVYFTNGAAGGGVVGGAIQRQDSINMRASAAAAAASDASSVASYPPAATPATVAAAANGVLQRRNNNNNDVARSGTYYEQPQQQQPWAAPDTLWEDDNEEPHNVSRSGRHRPHGQTQQRNN